MNVLSLFDGMSCGQIALNKLNIKYDNYYASEIDNHAIKVTQYNYPNTIQIGDITKIKSEGLPKIDLLIGGSPCQGFSFSGKQLNFNDPRSALFFEYVRLLKELKPKYFLLENVKMKKEYQNIISDALGVQPIEINSSLVSAQNRIRLYWTNIPNVTQPEDKCIYLKDVIQDGLVERDKSYCMDANYFKNGNLKSYLEKHRRQLVFFNYSSSGRGNGRVESRFYEATKAHTLTKTGYTNRAFTGVYEDFQIRKLYPIECERLQTVPDLYTEVPDVSNSQRYKMLGNGWTVDVIAHILSFANLGISPTQCDTIIS